MNPIEDKIPKTGRIGRFAKIVKKEVPKELMIQILQDSDKYSTFSPSKKKQNGGKTPSFVWKMNLELKKQKKY